ncbi:MAG: M20/M25/M40 family metallo-hydrolase [Myxococcales bacterium]|nr:M20/M25/M40 family metallo-hydrolase [Myxococcales bacterium]
MLFAMWVWGAHAAKPPAMPEYQTPPPVEHWRSKVDWSIAQNEAVARLAEYLQIDTVNPPGNELRGVEWLGSVLDLEEIAWRKVDLSEGRASLIARLEGSGADRPLCLMHHIDTVGFESDKWSANFANGPLSGAMTGGEVWGRGALDMKGMGVLQLLTMVWLKRLEVPLNRDVVLLAVAGEEVGNEGARQLAEMWEEIGCTYMINEGGIGIRDALFEGQAVHAISTAEKGVLWVDMHADGEAGHGSTPKPDSAPARLLEAMERIDRKYKPKYVLDPAMRHLLYNVGRHKRGLAGRVLRNKFLLRRFAWRRLKKQPSTAATMTDTVYLTGVSGAGESPNVVPSRVTATYDCRLLPDTTPEEHLERLEDLTDKIEGISFEVRLQGTSNASPVEDPLFQRIAHYAVEGRPDAVAGPLLSVGFTDSLILRPVGVKAYGYVPFEVSAELVQTMHGANERVPAEQVREGLRRLFSIVVDFAGG